jgi:hypothetical protein
LSSLAGVFKRSRLLCALFSAVLLSSCSTSSITVKPSAGTQLPRKLAVLPAAYTTDVTRERVDLVRSLVAAELRNKSFLVLDDLALQSLCSSPECPERSILASRYGVDGFVRVSVDSFSRSNFLAGYYNALSGTLKISNQANSPLFEVKSTSSDKGGLLFESGQVLQGIREQVNSSADQAFTKVASAFARTVVSEMPEGSNAPPALPPAPNINDVKLIHLHGGGFELCADGTPNSWGRALMLGSRTALRETSPGRYCAIFAPSAAGLLSSPVSIELRSAFGTASRKELVEQLEKACDLSNRVSLRGGEQRREIVLSCSNLPASPRDCGAEAPLCSIERFFVYRGVSETGPFLKIAESTKGIWRDAARPNPLYSYQVVSRSPSGLTSLPVAPKR